MCRQTPDLHLYHLEIGLTHRLRASLGYPSPPLPRPDLSLVPLRLSMCQINSGIKNNFRYFYGRSPLDLMALPSSLLVVFDGLVLLADLHRRQDYYHSYCGFDPKASLYPDPYYWLEGRQYWQDPPRPHGVTDVSSWSMTMNKCQEIIRRLRQPLSS